MTIVHLINLLGSDDPHWRDIKADRRDAPPEALAYVEQKIGICLLAQSSAIARPGIAIKPLSHRVLTWKSWLFQREDNHHELIREFGDQVWKKTAVLRART